MVVRTSKSKQQLASFRWKLVLVAVLLNLLCYVLVGWILYQSRLYHHERAVTTSQNTAKLLEQSIADMFDKIELNMYVIAEEITQQKTAGAIDDKVFSQFLDRLHMRMPEVVSIRVISAQGVITHGSGKTLVQKADVSDREYFKYLRDHQDAGTYISGPLVGRTSNDRILVLSRRINNPDGSFGGVINHAIELSYLGWLFSNIDIGQHGSISLRNDDLGIIVRYPEHDYKGDTPPRRTRRPELQEFARAKQQYGAFIAKSSLDGVERILSVRRVGKYPLYLIAGLAAEDYYANWRHAAVWALMALAIFSIVTTVMLLMLYQYWRDRHLLIGKLDRNQELFHAMADMSPDWFWVQDKNYRFINVSDEVTKKYGMSPEGLSGKTRWEVGVDKSEEDWNVHKALVEAHQPFSNFEYCFINSLGEKRCISVSGEPVFDEDGQFAGYRGVGRDITEKRRYEERIEQMAQYDNLTGLPNRALFHDRLALAISAAKREQREFALLYLDLDRFKPVNDQYGHDVGDQLLQTVASRIHYLLRESDTVARIGGDEFAVIIPQMTSRADVEQVAQRIITAVTSAYTLEGVDDKFSIGVSIGIALYPHNGGTGEELIKSADTAMYQSKPFGNRYSFGMN